MLTIDQIRQRLYDRRLERVAEATGLHYNTVRRIRDGDGENPSYRVVATLSAYLEGSNDQPA